MFRADNIQVLYLVHVVACFRCCCCLFACFFFLDINLLFQGEGGGGGGGGGGVVTFFFLSKEGVGVGWGGVYISFVTKCVFLLPHFYFPVSL